MAEEIAKEGKIKVRRSDREFLLKIRSGVFSYEELVDRANEKTATIYELFAASTLPNEPNIETAQDILIEMRERLYR
jgi:hypothetical protein